MTEMLAKATLITWALAAGWFLNDFFSQAQPDRWSALRLGAFTVTFILWVGTRPLETKTARR